MLMGLMLMPMELFAEQYYCDKEVDIEKVRNDYFQAISDNAKLSLEDKKIFEQQFDYVVESYEYFNDLLKDFNLKMDSLNNYLYEVMPGENLLFIKEHNKKFLLREFVVKLLITIFFNLSIITFYE